MSDEKKSGGGLMRGCVVIGVLLAGIAAAVVASLVGVGAIGGAWFAGTAAPDPVAQPEPASIAKDPQPTEGAGAAIRARGTLIVLVDTGEPAFTGTPPMYYPGADGKPDGFDYALAQRLATALGAADVRLMHEPYATLADRLTANGSEADVVISGYTPSGEPGISWSDSYLDYGLVLVVPASSKVRTVADLTGQAVGIFDDDAAAEEVGKLVKGYTELIRLSDGYWDQLVAGKFAGFLYDYPYAVAEINNWYKVNPSRAGSLRFAQYNLTESHYAVGVRSGDADLLAAVNAEIAAWKASDDYGAAVKRYLKGGLVVAPPASSRTVAVAAGDTLSAIAQRELGSVEKWKDLWAANRERFPNPHLIEVGDLIVLP